MQAPANTHEITCNLSTSPASFMWIARSKHEL
jgi:hypothetical protein